MIRRPFVHHVATRDSVLLGPAFPSRDDYRFAAAVEGPRGGRRACPPVYVSGVTRLSLQGVPLSQADRDAMDAVDSFVAIEGQAPGTLALRADCQSHFELYCSRTGVPPYAAWSPETTHDIETVVLDYLRYEAGAWGVGYSHLNNKRLAIRDAYDRLGHKVNPVGLMPRVSTFMRKYRKACGAATHKLEVEPGDLRLLLAHLDLSVDADLALWTAVLFAFFFLARLSEFCVGEMWALRVAHLTFYDRGGEVVPWWSPQVCEVEVFFWGSKNDQEKRGAYRSQFLSGSDPEWCIVRLLSACWR